MTAPSPPATPGSKGTVAFLHAHPDDEAIFTGGTMALLSAAGWRVVLVFATQGERGEVPDWLDLGGQLSVRRVTEIGRAAELLAVSRVEFLGYHDSGMAGDPANTAPNAFAQAPVDEAAHRLASFLATEEPLGALITYDENGIYGHPDHVQTHAVALRAAELIGVPTLYEATVDREYLHFVETHVVVEAGVPGAREARTPRTLGLAASTLGVPSVGITCTVDVGRVLDVKRAAMAAHASQIPETSSAMRLPTEHFAAVYGFEWFCRRGPAGPIDDLPQR